MTRTSGTLGRLAAALIVCALTASCGDSPAAPTPQGPMLQALVASQDSVTVARNTTVRLALRTRWSDGTGEDVTSSAAWSSSNSQVVTVQGGAVTAVGVGNATVTATYSGLSLTVQVVARRNTKVVGAITLAGTGSGSMWTWGWLCSSSVDLSLDDYSLAPSSDYSTVTGTRTWTFGLPPRPDVVAVPGAHRLGASVFYDYWCGAFNPTSSADSHVDVIDRDTGEALERIQLPPMTFPLTAGTLTELAWTIDVGVFK
jgi:hypothetical protein